MPCALMQPPYRTVLVFGGVPQPMQRRPETMKSTDYFQFYVLKLSFTNRFICSSQRFSGRSFFIPSRVSNLLPVNLIHCEMFLQLLSFRISQHFPSFVDTELKYFFKHAAGIKLELFSRNNKNLFFSFNIHSTSCLCFILSLNMRL